MHDYFSNNNLVLHTGNATQEDLLTMIRQAPNEAEHFWPVLMYPFTETEKKPVKDPATQNLKIYWNEDLDIHAFPEYLNQLVIASKNYTHHTEWNTMFENVYSMISTIMTEYLEFAVTFKGIENLNKIDKLNNLFKENTKDTQKKIVDLDFSVNPNPANNQNAHRYNHYMDPSFFLIRTVI